MIPQAMYRPRAAGPRHLSGLGSHHYFAPLRQMRLPLQGLGDPITDLVGGTLDNALQIVITRSAPMIQAQVQPMIKPLEIMLGVGMIASIAAAAFSFLQWKKTTSPSMGGGWF